RSRGFLRKACLVLEQTEFSHSMPRGEGEDAARRSLRGLQGSLRELGAGPSGLHVKYPRIRCYGGPPASMRYRIAKAARAARGLAGHFKAWLATVSDADRPPQRPGIDQDGDDSLCHTDRGQQQKLGIVEDGERSDTGRPEREQQNLNGGDGGHQNG